MVETINHIHNLIPDQFPTIYRENGELLVSFMEYYYELVDELDSNFRQAFILGDIDRAFEEFLIFYKNKYLDSIPVETDEDFRFIVKHIQDLYRRKGTEESIRLLFQLFFNEEIELFYPSSAILKASDSIYGSNFYLEMTPVYSVREYPIRKGDFLLGERSRATAFVDAVIFRNLDGAKVPIIYLSSKRGEFTIDDSLSITRGTSDSVFFKRPISGSMSLCEVLSTISTGVKVGDLMDVISDQYGFLGKVTVTKVNDSSVTSVTLDLDDGGYGYSTDNTHNEVFLSDQSLILLDGESIDNYIEPLSTISEASGNLFYTANNDIVPDYDNFSGSGRIIEVDNSVLFIIADGNDSANSFSFEYTDPDTSQTTTETVIPGGMYAKVSTPGGEVKIAGMSEYNQSASFEVASVINTETVKIITDIIQPYLGVGLDASDFGIRNDAVVNIDTPLKDAFNSIQRTIGEISDIVITNSGSDYSNDVRGTVEHELIYDSRKQTIGITFIGANPIITQGEIVTQEQFFNNLTYSDGSNYTAKIRFNERIGDVYYFTPFSFYPVDDDLPLVIRGQNYSINTITEVEASKSMGLNSRVFGNVGFLTGAIEEVKVADTGFKYIDSEIVKLSKDGVGYATAKVEVRGTGFTLGEWKTETSFLNNSSKFIRDNGYYQEFSYDVSSVINPVEYDKLVDDIVHVSGTKRFSSPLINSRNDAQVQLDVSIETGGVVDIPFDTEDGSNTFVVEGVSGNVLTAVIKDPNVNTTIIVVEQ